MKRTMAYRIAATVGALKRCRKDGNLEWADKHRERLSKLCRDNMPHGSGIDSTNPEEYCGLDVDASSEDKLIFHLSYHHMDESGYYDGWTDHTVTVIPEFHGVNIKISGRNRNDVKEYIHDCYYHSLTEWAEEYADQVTG